MGGLPLQTPRRRPPHPSRAGKNRAIMPPPCSPSASQISASPAEPLLPLPPVPRGEDTDGGSSSLSTPRYNAPAMLPKRTRRRRRTPLLPTSLPLVLAKMEKKDWIILAALTALALFLRLFRLDAMTEGLHHDEAITGLEAMRVLSDGYIGPFSASVGGQALGPAYWTALIFWIAEPTRFTLQLSMALLGAATVPAAYLLFRLSFGRGVALFAAVALAASHWHLYYSRSGFMLAAMPLVTTLSAAALLWALRSVRPGPVDLPFALSLSKGPGEKNGGSPGPRSAWASTPTPPTRGGSRSSRPCSAATPSWSATGRDCGPPASRSSPSASRPRPGRWRTSPSWTPMSF